MPKPPTAAPAARLTVTLSVDHARTRTRVIPDAERGLVELVTFVADGVRTELTYTPAEVRSLAAGLLAAADAIDAGAAATMALAGAS